MSEAFSSVIVCLLSKIDSINLLLAIALPFRDPNLKLIGKYLNHLCFLLDSEPRDLIAVCSRAACLT